jgi:hypothetical protein
LLASLFGLLSASGNPTIPYSVGTLIVFGLGLATAVRPDINLVAATATGTSVVIALEPLAHRVTAGTQLQFEFIAGIAAGLLALAVGQSLGAKLWDPNQPLPFENIPNIEPYESLRLDVTTAMSLSVLGGILVFVASWRSPLFHAGFWLSIAFALSAALASGPGLLAVGWRRYAATLAYPRKRIPRKLKMFFEWALLAGIFRRSASAYQFRHDALQRHFLSASFLPFRRGHDDSCR